MELPEAGTLIREARLRAGLTQQALAEELNMSRATLSQLENDVIAELGVRKLARICERVGLEVVIQPRRDAGIAPEALPPVGTRPRPARRDPEAELELKMALSRA